MAGSLQARIEIDQFHGPELNVRKSNLDPPLSVDPTHKKKEQTAVILENGNRPRKNLETSSFLIYSLY
jgi:hypothetical protein